MADDTRLPQYPLFGDLTPEDLAEVVPLMALRVLSEGAVIIEQGAEGTSMFVLARGTVSVSRGLEGGRDQTELARLRSGALFGEMALLTSSPRTARVVCERPAILFELDRNALNDLARRSGRVAEVLGQYTRQRLLRNLMATSSLFSPLDEPRREKLMQLFEPLVLDSGEAAVNEGEPSEHLYVVLSGGVVVTQQDDAGDVVTLADLEPGEVFGEISLIQRRPATATVRATSHTVLLKLSRAHFDEKVTEFPEVLAHIYKLAADREEANLQLARRETVTVEEDLLI
jgi:CRP-like cAMP-binding protein